MQIRGLRGFVRQSALAVVVLLLAPALASAATYYVRTDGNNSNDGLANSSARAWRTIAWAAGRVAPGDVVRVQSGTYPERVQPSVNGASVSQTVTFVADGSVTLCGWVFDNRSYIKVIGFIVDTDAGGCAQQAGCVQLMGTNNYVEFWHNTMRDASRNAFRIGLTDRINNSVILGNVLENFGIGNGSGMAVGIRGHNNLIAYNEVRNSHPDAFLMDGTYNRWTNNYTHSLSEASGGHSDILQAGSSTLGLSFNVIEANFQVGMGNLGDEHTTNISHGQSEMCSGSCGPMTENVFRRNVFHNVSSGTVGINQAFAGQITYNRYYNNTTAGAQRNNPTNRAGVYWISSGVTNGYIYNNIDYQAWGDSVSSGVTVYVCDGGCTVNYNLAYDPDGSVTFASPWTSQSNARSNVNPGFANYSGHNFTIGATSGARGAGGPLTTTAGSGNGTTFTVANRGGGFFRGANTSLNQYGGHLAAGDVITIGDDTRTIASVSGDSITVTSPFTWNAGDPVFFGSSATVDVGAFPFKSTGYGLTATAVQSGGTVTVTPSDPDLVRFVVCSENGIPVAADSTSPFTCAVGGGSVDVKVYPRYASKTLWVNASTSTSPPPPAAPSNVRIIR